MPKPYEEFKVSDWDWLSEHFEPSKAERMAKVAWSIARSTPETIPQHSLTLDPLIVIPLCAISLQDDINISVLRSNKSFRSQTDIEQVLRAIEPSPRWRYLFDSLTPELQFDLLDRLIIYRRPTIGDWRNLFREAKYEFKTSCHYRLVLFLALAMSMVAIAEILQIIDRQPENWSNGLLGLAILVVIVFWVFLWRGIEEELEPTTFTSFGLFGVFTFWSELRRLFREQIVWSKVEPLMNYFTYTLALFLSLSWLTASNNWLTALFLALPGGWALAWVLAFPLVVVGAKARARDLVRVRAFPLAMALFGAWAWPVALTWAWLGALAWAWPVALTWAGFRAWIRAKDKQDFGKFLAVFASPFFCWSPIVFYFSTLALLEFLSWLHMLFAWLTLIVVGTGLWLRGQKLEEQNHNPLKGILPRTKKLN